MTRDIVLALLLLAFAAVESNSMSPPGKPVLLGCRSPEKETFTCWWEPGSDGGLPTTHRLYYERERLEGVHECPDYHSAGENSCFFDKDHTSIWIDYYLTVVACNAVGNATSDTFKMEVMDVVKPNVPENITLLLEKEEDSPCLHIRWQRPHETDTKSGWVTVKYELRVKQENGKWKEYASGTQTQFSLYSITPGVAYLVQVRCRLDHSAWSEWSDTSYVKVPNYLQSEKPFWMLVSALSAIPFMLAVCFFVMKREYVKQCVLPPVPGPKIRGVDFQLLKSGRSEDLINALIVNQNFPLMVAWKDQMEEFLIVTENTEPSNSQKRKRSLSIPAGFRLESDIQCKKSSQIQTECKRADMEPSQSSAHKQPFLSINCANTEATEQDHAVKAFTGSSYVDIRTHVEDMQEVDYSRVKQLNGDNTLTLEKKHLPPNCSGCTDVQRLEGISEDYSRVREVDSDNVILLQKQGVPVHTSCRELGNHSTDKSTNLHVTGCLKVGVCKELINSGYVDTLPKPPSM